jgi:hypothetical protein
MMTHAGKSASSHNTFSLASEILGSAFVEAYFETNSVNTGYSLLLTIFI